MRRYLFVILSLGLSIYFLGCGKKEQPLEEMQAPMSIETLGTVGTETKTAVVAPETKPQVSPVIPEVTQKMESMSAQAAKPTVEEIQTALKNAGFYTGQIDGKSGPMTKKAIQDFQKANNLKVDGKVGPMTWNALSKHLTSAPATGSEVKPKR